MDVSCARDHSYIRDRVGCRRGYPVRPGDHNAKGELFQHSGIRFNPMVASRAMARDPVGFFIIYDKCHCTWGRPSDGEQNDFASVSRHKCIHFLCAGYSTRHYKRRGNAQHIPGTNSRNYINRSLDVHHYLRPVTGLLEYRNS